MHPSYMYIHVRVLFLYSAQYSFSKHFSVQHALCFLVHMCMYMYISASMWNGVIAAIS